MTAYHVLPALSPSASAIDYFWHQLPVAMPGLFSFLICTFFALGAFQAWFKNRRNLFMLHFSIFSLGVGCIALALAFRALMNDLDALLRAHTFIYPVAMLMTPGAMAFNYHLMERRYKALKYTAYFLWLTVIAGWIAIFTGNGYKGVWHHYWFGNYPVAKPLVSFWGLAGTIGLFFVVLPCMLHFRKVGRNLFKDPIGIGVNLTCLLIALNLPSLAGYSVFPGANFMFIPMCLIAYGVFRKDFFNLNVLFFEKRGLFYAVAALISILFIATALAMLTNAQPSLQAPLYSNPLTPIAAFSAICVFSIAVYLAGSNPQNKVHMMGALSLIITGFFMIVLIVSSLGLPVLMNRRLEQLAYLIFVFAPSVQYRFVFMLLNERPSWAARLIDAGSAISALLVLSPFFFGGYFEYFGRLRVSEAGIGLSFFSFVGTAALATVLVKWYKLRHRSDKSVRLIIGGFLLGAAFMVTNIPTSQGIFFPPLGALQFIAAAIITYAIIRHKAIAIKGEAARVAGRFQVLFFTGLFVLIVLHINTLPAGLEKIKVLNYVMILGGALLVGFNMLLFVLVRPIAVQIDESFEMLETQKKKLEISEMNLQDIAAVSRRIYASGNITEIQEILFEAIKHRFKINSLWLLFVDEDKRRIFTAKHGAAIEYSPETERFLQNFSEPLEEGLGSLYWTYKRKKVLYMRRLDSPEKMTPTDQKIVASLSFDSYIHVPLVVQNQVIGILAGVNYGASLNLTRQDINALELFLGQVTGAVYTARLLRDIRNEQKKSESLLLNILPGAIADELKNTQTVKPVMIPSATVLFTDFVGFTLISQKLSPTNLLKELDGCFTQFDQIAQRFNLEKLKTIGDAYMCAGGIPIPNNTHFLDACLAALEIRAFMKSMEEIKRSLGEEFWQLRIGIHSGPVVAGVIGQTKFAYDIWGDTVNTTSRLQSTGVIEEINISLEVYEKVRFFFVTEYRGKVSAKNKGKMDVFLLKGLKPKYAEPSNPLVPNKTFREVYDRLKNGASLKPGRVARPSLVD